MAAPNPGVKKEPVAHVPVPFAARFGVPAVSRLRRRPRDYGKKLNKKMYRVGMRSLVSELVRQDRLILIDKLGVTEPRTKQMQARLPELGVDDALLLTDGLDSAVYLAARNIPNIQVMDIAIVDPVSLVSRKRLSSTRRR